jgi:hypothetical protein
MKSIRSKSVEEKSEEALLAEAKEVLEEAAPDNHQLLRVRAR